MCYGCLVPTDITARNSSVQSRWLEGRSCHVSLFAREPFFCSAQHSPPAPSSLPTLVHTWLTHLRLMTPMLLLLLITLFFPISHLVPLDDKTLPLFGFSYSFTLVKSATGCPPALGIWMVPLPKQGLL